MSNESIWDEIYSTYREHHTGEKVFVPKNSVEPYDPDNQGCSAEFKEFVVFLMDEGHVTEATFTAVIQAMSMEASIDMAMKGADVFRALELSDSSFANVFPGLHTAVNHLLMGVFRNRGKNPAQVFRLIQGKKGK